MEALKLLLGYAQTGLYFLLMITVLIAVHELGHFWVARLSGMHVEAFAVFVGGKRSTDLTPYLKSSLCSQWIVVGAGLLAAIAAFFGASMHITPVYLAGFAFLAIGIPIWVATRLAALYHCGLLQGLKPIAYGFAGGLITLFFATKFKNIGPSQVLSLLLAGGIIGILMLYYRPIGSKDEDDTDTPQGHGEITIDGAPREVLYRPLWSRVSKSGTEYSLLMLPLGGFARMRGMVPKPDGSETQIPQGFYSKSPFARFLTLLAGPLFSILLGIAMLAVSTHGKGLTEPLNEPIIGSVATDGAAAKAGIKPDDKVTAIDGKPVTTFYDLTQSVFGSEGKPLTFEILRGEQKLTLVVTPKKDTSPAPVLTPDLTPSTELKTTYRIGVGYSMKTRPATWGESFGKAAIMPIGAVQGLIGTFTAPATMTKDLGGLGSVVQATHQASDQGFYTVLALAGGISISLGIMNLLPIHPLDGGQMLIAFVEMFRGRRLSYRSQGAFSGVGFVLMMLLIVMIAIADVGRLTGGGQ